MEGVISTDQQPFDTVSQARNYMLTDETQKDITEQLVRGTAFRKASLPWKSID